MPWLKDQQISNPSLTPAIDWKNHAQLLTPTIVTASSTSLTWKYGGTTWTTTPNGNTSKSTRFTAIYYYLKTPTQKMLWQTPPTCWVSAISLSLHCHRLTTVVTPIPMRYGPATAIGLSGTGYDNANTSYTIPGETVSFELSPPYGQKRREETDYASTRQLTALHSRMERHTLLFRENGTISLVNAENRHTAKNFVLSGFQGYRFILRHELPLEGEVLVGNNNLKLQTHLPMRHHYRKLHIIRNYHRCNK